MYPVDGLKYNPANISGTIEYNRGSVPPNAITGAKGVTPWLISKKERETVCVVVNVDRAGIF